MRKIFIGSSSEGLRYAEQIRDLLNAQQNVRAILWTEIFEPGTLTFEAIERVSHEISGAVLLATPDDDSIIRGVQVKVPRTNVMIEFGFLTAVLGRRKIALCRYNGVELATDLNAFTYVAMGEFQGPEGSQLITASAATQLMRWIQSLSDLPEGFPHSVIVHGYSGRWKVKNRFLKWRFKDIFAPGYVDFDGVLDLVLGDRGNNGSGSVYGDLYVHLTECYAHISFSTLVENAFCDEHGELTFISRMHSRQLVSLEGSTPFEEGFKDSFRGPNHGTWILKPSAARTVQLTGRFTVNAGNQVSDEADSVIDKLPF